MKKGKMPEENLHIIKQELITMTERLEELCFLEKDIQDLKLGIKGLKLFWEGSTPSSKNSSPIS
jgi:hypothetical protein